MTTRFSTIGTLIIDDSLDECALLHVQLRRLPSMRVIGVVHDGLEAIAYLRGVHRFQDRKQFPYPELMLLDFKMPHCNGMQVLNFLRHQHCRPRVVLWSNALEQLDVTTALKLGADVVCEKPANFEELADIIQRLESVIFKRIVNFVSWKTKYAGDQFVILGQKPGYEQSQLNGYSN